MLLRADAAKYFFQLTDRCTLAGQESVQVISLFLIFSALAKKGNDHNIS